MAARQWLRPLRAWGGRGGNSGSSFRPPPAAVAAAAAAAAAAAGLLERRRCCCEDERGLRVTASSLRRLGDAASKLRKPGKSSEKKPEKLVLAADCGGTTTRLMLYRVAPDAAFTPKRPAPGTLLREEKYPNIMFKSLKEIIEVFLSHDSGVKDPHPTVAVLALAGIVLNNQCRFTNLDWVVDGNELERDLGIGKVELINDFVAQGYGMLTLGDDEVTKVNDATPFKGAPMACIGAGTGLGQCFLVSDADGAYHCFPSEGGHGEFGPRGAGSNDVQIELLKYLKIKFSGWNRISVERVVSGTGICNIYEFLAHQNPEKIDPKVHRMHQLKPKDAGIIAQHAWPGSISERTLKIFAQCYGAQVGTVALTLMPLGGIYVTGGVTKRLSEWLLEDGSFLSAYFDKGRLTPICEKVPVFFVKGDDMGQRGAHYRAVHLLKEHLVTQARAMFNDLDVDKNGFITLTELRTVCGLRGEAALADHLLELVDTDKDGVIEFDEFFACFCMLSPKVTTQTKLGGGREEVEHWRKEELVAPPDRGNDEQSRAELAQMMSKYKARNRRIHVDDLQNDQNQPAFKSVLFKLKQHGNRKSENDWMEREYWITKGGSVLYFSKTEGRTLLYCTRQDLINGDIEVITDQDSMRPFIFRLHPKPSDGTELVPTEFAAPSEAGRAFWVQMLEELQVPPKPAEDEDAA